MMTKKQNQTSVDKYDSWKERRQVNEGKEL